MLRTVDDWIRRLEPDGLPVLRATADEIARLARQAETVSVSGLAKPILHDPMLTFRVLQLANQSRGRHFDSEITTVEHAVMLVGIGPMLQYLTKLTVVESVLKGETVPLQLLRRAIMRAFHAAYQARDWAILHLDMEAEEVYIAALLETIANLMVWIYAPDMALKMHRFVSRDGMTEETAQIRVLGFRLNDLRQALLRYGRLPETLRDLMASHGELPPRTRLVRIALTTARLSEKGWFGAEWNVIYEELGESLRISPGAAAAVIHGDAVIAGRGWRRYGVTPPAAWLPLLPGDWPPEPLDEETAKGKIAPVAPPAVETTAFVPHPEKLKQAMDEIAAHLDGTLNLHDMMTVILRGMREGIGLNRVVFALMSHDRGGIKARYVTGAAPDSPLRGFQFDLKTPHLFSRLMTKAQAVWLHDANRAGLSPLIPPALRQLTGGCDFFAMSILVHGKPLGLIYADRNGAVPLDEHSYLEFKQLCLRASQGLSHLAAS